MFGGFNSTSQSKADLENQLKNLRKQNQKNMIQYFVAPSAVSSSNSQKKAAENKIKDVISDLTKQSSSYNSKLASSAKGKWVTKAKESVEKSNKKFQSI